MVKREILRKRIFDLSRNNCLTDKDIYLHGCDSYQMIKILYNCALTPKGILVDKKREKSQWGVEKFTYEEVDDYSNSIIFTSESDYPKINLERMRNAFIYIDALPLNEFCGNIDRKDNLEKILKIGSDLYNYLLNKYASEKEVEFLIYNYTGLGDAYIIAVLLQNYQKRFLEKKFVLITMSKECGEIFDMFGQKYIEVVTINEVNALEKLALLCGENLQIKNLMQSPEYDAYLMKRFHGTKFNLLEMYQYYIFGLPENIKLNFTTTNKNIAFKQYCIDMNIIEGNSVILSPYAKSIVGFNKKIWEKIAIELKLNGYKVFTNCANFEKEIEETNRISVPIRDIAAVVEYAGNFVGIRSGLCDVISQTEAKKIIIYPDYLQFNRVGTYEFASFKEMKFGKNVIEHKIKFTESDLLPELITRDLKIQFN